MKILLIEDDPHKAESLLGHIACHYANASVRSAASFQTGIRTALSDWHDIILCDMSLPTYDIKGIDSGYEMITYAGRLILTELKAKGKATPVVIVTQYTTFSEMWGTKHLAEVNEELHAEFSDTYLGAIFYCASEDSWKSELISIIDRICIQES